MARIQLSDFDDAVFSIRLECPAALHPGAHTDNVQFLQLAAQARTAFFAALGHSAADAAGVRIFVGDQMVQYKAEAFPHQLVEMHMAVRDVVDKGFDLAYRMVDASSQQLILLGKIGVVCVHPVTKRPCAIPERLLQQLAHLQPLHSVSA